MPPPRNRRRLIPFPSSEPDFYLINTQFPFEGQENGDPTDLDTAIQQTKPPAVRDGNNMQNFQGNSKIASNPQVAQLQSTSDHGISLGLASIPCEATVIASTSIGAQQLSTSAYAQALFDCNTQMEATREQVLENLKAQNTVTEILRQARQQELTSRLLQSSLNVGLRLPPPQLNSINDVDYLRSTLANEMTPNLSNSLGVISDLQRNMLRSQASQPIPAIDDRLVQFFQDYQNNNPFNL